MNLGPSDFAELANTLKAVRPDEVEVLEESEEIKACGANKPGGGGFSAGNTCARGGKGGGASEGVPLKKSELYIGRTVEIDGKLAKLASATAHGGPWMVTFADGTRGFAEAKQMRKTDKKVKWSDIPST